MIWYDHMFLGTDFQSNVKKIKRRISNRSAHIGVYLITLPTCDHRILEIIPSALLMQDEYPTEDLRIIGMASTRKEALQIVEKIISESFRTRGDVNIEAFMDEYDNQGG